MCPKKNLNFDDNQFFYDFLETQKCNGSMCDTPCELICIKGKCLPNKHPTSYIDDKTLSNIGDIVEHCSIEETQDA